MIYFPVVCAHILVVTQFYQTDPSQEYVIRGNSVVIKCQIPSYVADFVEVVSWHIDEETYMPGNVYGL